MAPATTVKTAASAARDTPVGELEQLRDCMAADHSASRKRAVIVPGMRILTFVRWKKAR